MKMKVRCIGYNQTLEETFTIGKVYIWKDNTLTSDKGFVYEALVDGADISKWELNNWYRFEKVEDDSEEMTDREIWDMLKDKMEKNDITGFYFAPSGLTMYGEGEMMQAVSLAYRCGYFRSEKGRPFRYGEKK